jgi:Bax protein
LTFCFIYFNTPYCFWIEGNALFGVRTWDPKLPQIKPKDNPKAVWGVKVYKTKCQSIQDYVDLLNSHPAYKDFRELREEMVIAGIFNYDKLIDTLDLFSTNPEYTTLLKATVQKLKVITAN